MVRYSFNQGKYMKDLVIEAFRASPPQDANTLQAAQSISSSVGRSDPKRAEAIRRHLGSVNANKITEARIGVGLHRWDPVKAGHTREIQVQSSGDKEPRTVTVRTLSSVPPVFMVEGIATAAECDAIRRAGEAELTGSKTYKAGGQMTNKKRTSSSKLGMTFKMHAKAIPRVLQRAAQIINVTNALPHDFDMQLVKYVSFSLELSLLQAVGAQVFVRFHTI